MKIFKLIFALMLAGTAAVSAQAQDNWSVGVVVGNPYPPAYYAPPAVVYAPPPVVIYPHPQSRYYYSPPAVAYSAPVPPPGPGFIQFSYGNGGYGGYNYGPRNYNGGGYGGWGRGHHHHHRHD
ncbi:hypothetical protein [Methylophilus sp. 3sh_L]|uniref:hypothetical protein n=1 Tax=Methylophilus sp. 3sh_L TaxID=3377114 RepID=UPI00398F430A